MTDPGAGLATDGEARSSDRDRERPAPSPAALRQDVLVGLAATVLGVASLELYRSTGFFVPPEMEDDATVSLAEGAAWVAAMTLPLCVRRRFPLTVMLVCSAVFVATGLRSPVVALGYAHQLGLFAAIYTAGAWARDRTRLRWLRGGVLVFMLGWVVQQVVTAGEAAPPDGPGSLDPATAAAALAVGINLAYFGGAWWVGDLAWRTARQRARLAEQAAQLREASDEISRQAVLDERLRIARELHDVVAHHVSVVGVQAGAARRVLDRRPEDARTALASIEDSSRRAVGEMRELLGVLRGHAAEDGGHAAPRAPQPGLDALDALVRECAEQGLDVDLRRFGRPVAVPETVQLSLYRVAQEALANVRRHSTARTARVVLRYLGGPEADPGAAEADDAFGDPWAVELEVLDDGLPSGATGGTGLGHVGMRERAALHGGDVEIGPRPYGGYRVRVRYPVPSSAVRGGADPVPSPERATT